MSFHKWSRFTTLVAALAMVGLVLSGCQQQQQKRDRRPPKVQTKKMPAKPTPQAPLGDVIMADGRDVRTLAVPTGERSTSTILIEKSVPSEVILGQPFDYTITVTSLVSHALTDVGVSDSLPNGLTIQSSDPAANETSGGTTLWVLGDLPPGASRTINVRAIANQNGEFTYCARVSYDQLACTKTRVVEPALQLTKTGPAEVLSCEPIMYTVTVSNNGTGHARNVVVTTTCRAA